MNISDNELKEQEKHDTPYFKGYAAGWNEDNTDTNPFERNTQNYYDWLDGHRDGKSDMKEHEYDKSHPNNS